MKSLSLSLDFVEVEQIKRQAQALHCFDEIEQNRGSGPLEHDFRIPHEKSVWRIAPMTKMEQVLRDSGEVRLEKKQKGQKIERRIS
jgi:hypothetical protein